MRCGSREYGELEIKLAIYAPLWDETERYPPD